MNTSSSGRGLAADSASSEKLETATRSAIEQAVGGMELLIAERDKAKALIELQAAELIALRVEVDQLRSTLRIAEIARDLSMESAAVARARLHDLARQLRAMGDGVDVAIQETIDAKYRQRAASPPELSPGEEARLDALAAALAPAPYTEPTPTPQAGFAAKEPNHD